MNQIESTVWHLLLCVLADISITRGFFFLLFVASERNYATNFQCVPV